MIGNGNITNQNSRERYEECLPVQASNESSWQ